MKLYMPEPAHLVKLQISQQGAETEYLTLTETTKDECKKWLIDIITKNVNVNPFGKQRLTKVYIRDAIGGKNGKAISASFRGLLPKATAQLIINELTKKTKQHDNT